MQRASFPKDHRDDIDGLRAIAVLSVLVYHYRPSWMQGGFAGVDMFFVISGYLITGKLVNDINANGYAIWPLLTRFYHDRIKRIFPAALTMLGLTLFAGWFLLTPNNFASLGESAIYSAFGAGNIFFFLHTNYFDQQSGMLPLLHMWSLGVEEQFYIAWPFVLVATMWLSRSNRWAILTLIGATSALSLLAAVSADPKSAFYLPWYRAWELGAGALLVFIPRMNNRIASELAGVFGLVMVAYTLFTLRDDGASIGFAMVPAVAGSAFLLVSRGRNAVARLLSIRPIRFVGLVSYSFYLWHWPILVFFRHYALGATPSIAEAGLLTVVSFGLAVVSWHFVERLRKTKRPTNQIIPAGIAAMCAVAALSFAVRADDGIPQRFPKEAQAFLGLKYYGIAGNPPNCSITADIAPQCLSYNGKKLKILVLGDSYAGHLMPGLQDQFPDAYITKLGATGCRPVIDGTGKANCVSLMKAAFEKHIPNGHFDVIVVAGRWLGSGIKTIRKTTDYLEKFGRVYVVGSPMEYDTHLPELLLSRYLIRDGSSLADHSLIKKVRELDDSFREQLSGGNAVFVPMVDTICAKNSCGTLTHSGVPYQFDYGHLTMEGSVEIVRRMVKAGFLRGQGQGSTTSDSSI